MPPSELPTIDLNRSMPSCVAARYCERTMSRTVTRGKVLASFPRYSLVRGTARRLRYRVSGRGDVFYYSSRDVDRLAEDAGISQHRLVHVESSGGGVILVGDNRR